MRRLAIITLSAALAAGCGSPRHAAVTTTAKPKPLAGLRIGVVGPLAVAVPGAVAEHGTLARVSGDALVLVDAAAADVARVAAAADRHPATHFALVGGSTKGFHRPNLVGLVLREEQAAQLAGVVAGFVADEQGGADARVAWVGPQERMLAAAYAGGVHRSLPAAGILSAWSERLPSRCKEAALGVIARGAVVVTAHRGLCADAVAVAAHQQNHVALSVADFELPGVPATIVARDAVAGVYHGGEDLVFGATSGAIGVRRLDPRISMATALRARAAAQELASGLPPSG
jgi:basic membrane lipoprotein Med (substrate-binding protein (PBP1-ABC) superfamily)